MCFSHESRPPIAPIEGAAIEHRRLELTAADGNRFAAFHAAARQPSGAAMLVLPDVRGLAPYYEELALRFAEIGVDALALDYYGRTAGPGPRDASFDHAPHRSKTTWTGLSADAEAAIHALREASGVSRLHSVGFCFGGRLSFLLAAQPGLGMAGVIGFYGWPVGDVRGGMPAPADLAPEISAPVLGLFGGADEGISGADVAAFESALASAGVEHRVVTYPGAPHSFFDRKQEVFAEASAAAWSEVLDFIGQPSGPQARAS